jgi:hypothetical protein
MKRLAFAALVASAATVASAQGVPPPACGAIPEYPGRLGSNTQKSTFDKAYRVYDKCIRDYVASREAAIKENQAAAQKAVDDFNGLVLKMRADSGEDISKKPGDVATPAAPEAPATGRKAGNY